MPMELDRYNSGTLLDIIRRPGDFGRLDAAQILDPLHDLPPIYSRYVALYGTVINERGELADEMEIDTDLSRYNELKTSELEDIINGQMGLSRQMRTVARHQGFADLLNEAFERCEGQGYRVLAAVKLGIRENGLNAVDYFHALPLEEPTFGIRERWIERFGTAENELADTEEAVIDVAPPETPPEAAADIRFNFRHPDFYTRRLVGMMMGSLLLPEVVGGDIEPI